MPILKGHKMTEAKASTTTSVLDARETFDLIAADKVEGTTVYNRAGEKLGTVDSIMIDKLSGEVAYAVMSFGGFHGIGNDLSPLSGSGLTCDQAMAGDVVGRAPDLLKNGPGHGGDDKVDRADEACNRR